MKPLVLDLCCGAGCASEGYVRAGFDVVGVDINLQPHYRWEFYQADALEFLATNSGFDAVHVSPPCQRWSHAQRIQGRDHPDLITPIREMLLQLQVPYVIENVWHAPLWDPIELCGASFPGLRVYRHRLFETWPFSPHEPRHPQHRVPLVKMGRRASPDEYMHVVGHPPDLAQAKAAMGVTWSVTGDELAQAIPPVYAEYVGLHLRGHLMQRPAPQRPFYRRDVVVSG